MKEKLVYFEKLGKIGTRLVYGTATPVLEGADQGAAFDVLDRAWEAGFRSFDSAYSYGNGNAEKNLGAWMASRGVRKSALILDKGCNPVQKGSPDTLTPETIREQVKISKDRLQTEKVEFYLLHRDDEKMPVGPIVEVLNELKDNGDFSVFGVSNWRLNRIIEADEYAHSHGLEGMSAFSPSFSLANYTHDIWNGSVTISGEENEDYREWLYKTQYPVFSYSALARGYLSGKFNPKEGKPIEECLGEMPISEYDSPKNRERLNRLFEMAEKKGCAPSQLALAYVLNQKINFFPIINPGTTSHMEETMGALRIELSDSELKWLEA